jgi:predicted dehydrogenase
LLCEALDPASGEIFPLTIRVHRIAPGQKNTWYLEVYGTRVSAVYSTREPKRLGLLEYAGGEQVWGEVQMGYETPFPTITGAIFEFGFTDALLQMWAAFLYELAHGRPVKPFAGTVTPAEAALSHRLFTAANQSQRQRAVVPV